MLNSSGIFATGDILSAVLWRTAVCGELGAKFDKAMLAAVVSHDDLVLAGPLSAAALVFRDALMRRALPPCTEAYEASLYFSPKGVREKTGQ
jgi:hypothetical protein